MDLSLKLTIFQTNFLFEEEIYMKNGGFIKINLNLYKVYFVLCELLETNSIRFVVKHAYTF